MRRTNDLRPRRRAQVPHTPTNNPHIGWKRETRENERHADPVGFAQKPAHRLSAPHPIQRTLRPRRNNIKPVSPVRLPLPSTLTVNRGKWASSTGQNHAKNCRLPLRNTLIFLTSDRGSPGRSIVLLRPLNAPRLPLTLGEGWASACPPPLHGPS